MFDQAVHHLVIFVFLKIHALLSLGFQLYFVQPLFSTLQYIYFPSPFVCQPSLVLRKGGVFYFIFHSNAVKIFFKITLLLNRY